MLRLPRISKWTCHCPEVARRTRATGLSLPRPVLSADVADGLGSAPGNFIVARSEVVRAVFWEAIFPFSFLSRRATCGRSRPFHWLLMPLKLAPGKKHPGLPACPLAGTATSPACSHHSTSTRNLHTPLPPHPFSSFFLFVLLFFIFTPRVCFTPVSSPHALLSAAYSAGTPWVTVVREGLGCEERTQRKKIPFLT